MLDRFNFVLILMSCYCAISGTFNSCRTSSSDSGEGDRGQLDAPCQFPFTLRNKTYYACTFDYSHITGYKPWCSTKVDRNGNHISGGKNWGVCDDNRNCPIPPRLCGEPVRTRRLPDERDDDVDFEQMPWMASLGTYDKYAIKLVKISHV